jgi:hypothetical protein
MIAKRLVSGVLAFAIAIGSAFGTMSMPHDAYVKLKFFGSTIDQCVNTGIQCGDFGTTACRIEVQTAVGLLIVNAKRDPACTSVMTDDSYMPMGYYESPFGIVIGAQ